MAFQKGYTPWNKGKTGLIQLKRNNSGTKNPFYGKRHSEETKLKMQKAKLGKYVGEKHPFYGKHWSEEMKKKLSLAHKEQHSSPTTEFKKGHIPWSKGKKLLAMQDEKNPFWKGDLVSYSGLHKWVAKKLGKPNMCEFCGEIFEGRNIHWANKSGEYKRDLSDWLRLCVKCHRAYDGGRIIYGFGT